MCRALYVLQRHDEMQVGLSTEEKQQLQGVTLEQLLAAMKAASFSFSHGRSAFRGVYIPKATQKYRARIRVNGKSINLGQFELEEDAAYAYDKAAFAVSGRYTVMRASI